MATLLERPETKFIARQGDSSTKPECGTGSAQRSYNTPLHVFALILILVLSTIGTMRPTTIRYDTVGTDKDQHAHSQ